jgi:hypothetical protein
MRDVLTAKVKARNPYWSLRSFWSRKALTGPCLGPFQGSVPTATTLIISREELAQADEFRISVSGLVEEGFKQALSMKRG